MRLMRSQNDYSICGVIIIFELILLYQYFVADRLRPRAKKVAFPNEAVQQS